MKKFFLFILFCSCNLLPACDSSDPSEEINEEPEEKEVVATVRVMSYNIHHANPPSRSGVIDLDAVVNVIRAQSPDLVALQEVDLNTERSGMVDQAAYIADALEMYYYFGKAIDYQGGTYGVAILSKYRLLNPTTYGLPLPAGGESRVMAAATVKLPDSTAVVFASTHIDAQSNPANRLAQTGRIVQVAANGSMPFIVGGDFNAEPGSEEIDVLDSHFDRTCRLCAPTIPATTPTRAIDFIAFHHPENKFDVETHKVVDESYASDHRPVLAVINLTK